ncbi:MAG: hypothetical protein ACOX4V_04355 [Anaerovoracaceae bacterium]|jgi:hypothetical protein
MGNMIAFSIIPFISYISVVVLYVLAAIALVYIIKALRIYIKKNSDL